MRHRRGDVDLEVATVELMLPGRALPLEGAAPKARVLLRIGRVPVASPMVALGAHPDASAARLLDDLAASRLPGCTHGIAVALARHLLARPVDPRRSALEQAMACALGEATGDPPGRASPTLTAAVCTRGRPASLARTLRSLESAARGSEVLVVDNSPPDTATEALVRESFPWVRYVVEPSPGLDHARNHALRESRGDVVAFADDDVVVDPGWVATIQAVFCDAPEADLATGLVEPLSLDTWARRIFEAYGGFVRGFSRRWVHAPPGASRIAFSLGSVGAHGTGASMAVRRTRALELGGFDPALDTGTATGGGGDLEFMFRTLKAGGMLAYEPASVVRHEHRASLEELVSQLGSWGTGMRAYLERTARAYPEERIGATALRYWLYGTWMTRRALRSLVVPSFPPVLLWHEFSGSLRGAALYREASKDTPAPAAPRAPTAVADLEDSESVQVDVNAEVNHLTNCGSKTVRVRAHAGSRQLGTIQLQPIHGVIGAARLRDAIGAHFRQQLFGMTDRELARAFVARLRRTAWATKG